ncbi:hypothetical protein [Mesorhizobium sp. M8A.F.Ca.ET.021.01.1.1]|uniref:hypothetical protein n=1 Tax=Mesorhizobium sp. M8A.F.Ca.ET.021.01.1.1 TaxID=2496757 RepID=UPI000FCBB2AE|nr:hypothetical protein [Mesorhizobium sp. M8A.F.Ca.ET.021.01.1.1]RUW56841.1 hypothetical protein EOA36_02255 [Mesorhizobium sp. M8A.F.Ca.ET.021.01.1.1]
MKWIPDPEEDDETTQLCMSGDVAIGNVLKSGSGRWRWAIVPLPGMDNHREALRGWMDSEYLAKVSVERLFTAWCEKAGLSAEVR